MAEFVAVAAVGRGGTAADETAGERHKNECLEGTERAGVGRRSSGVGNGVEAAAAAVVEIVYVLPDTKYVREC